MLAAFLIAIAPFIRVGQCESHMTNVAYGPYRGYWQFADRTWEDTTGLPGSANQYSIVVQLEGAVKLEREVGWHSTASWPVCGWAA